MDVADQSLIARTSNSGLLEASKRSAYARSGRSGYEDTMIDTDSEVTKGKIVRIPLQA